MTATLCAMLLQTGPSHPIAEPAYLITVAISVVSLFIAGLALFYTRQKHLGREPRSKLKLELDRSRNERSGFCTRGWMENPAVQVEDDDASSKPMSERSRIPVYFARARITNMGPFTAKTITLCLTGVEDLNNKKAGDDNPLRDIVQPLRWSDSWTFEADKGRKEVTARQGVTTFTTLPQGAFRYCDLCFYYDLQGSERMGRFRRRRAYFAVENLPSHSYSIPDGEYKIKLHLSAENCDSFECTFKLTVNFGIADEYQRMRFEEHVR